MCTRSMIRRSRGTPLAYLTEPGYWTPTEAEAGGLRGWIEKGGFLLVDDVRFERQWAMFKRAMGMVLPNARILPMDV